LTLAKNGCQSINSLKVMVIRHRYLKTVFGHLKELEKNTNINVRKADKVTRTVILNKEDKT